MRYAMMIMLLCFVVTGLGGCGRTPSFSYQAGTSDEDFGEAGLAAEAADVRTEDTDSVQNTEVACNGERHIIFVDVCGEVLNPGVYQLDEDARVCDAVFAAGGFTKDAARQAVNQARPLKDGEQLVVPSFQDVEESGLAVNGNGMSDGLVNINTAGENELMSLPGIGATRAADIISYRTEHGNFQSIEDLMQVPGIKEGLYQKIKDKIKV